MDRKTRKVLTILLTPFIIGFILGFIAGGCTKRHSSGQREASQQIDANKETVEDEISTAPQSKEIQEETAEREQKLYHTRRPIKYAAVFNDVNEVHLNEAKKVGLSEPLKTRDEIPGCKDLVRLHSNRLYTIEDLRFSSPYLTKNAAGELETIARAFKDSLKSKDLLDYKLIVSSVLRTQEDVKNLRKSGNPNASANSAHCYGTTFDIRYAKYEEDHNDKNYFMHHYELTKVLGEVLLDQKKAGNCLVKYEKKEHCFHITSTH